MIKSLEHKIQHNLRSGVAIASFAQCVEEIVLNAVDACSTCIATRVDLNQGKVQVVDNGRGINRDDLNRVCERYHTSKCKSLEDVERDLQHYGYRGEALASMRSMCFLLEIETRSRTDPTTYSKLFRESEKAEIRESKVHRPSAGTTITVYDLFYAMPVRKKSLNESLEFERIRQRLEAIALIHPKISFSLRNDQTCAKVLQTHKANSVVGAFSHLFGNQKSRVLCEVKNTEGDFQIQGYIGKDSHHNKSLQFVYINERLVLKTRIHKQITLLLSKTTMMKKKLVTGKQDSKATSQYSPEGISPRRYAEKHGIFVLNIICPLSAYDITFDPAKTLVEFKDWGGLLNCAKVVVDRFIDENSLRANVELTSNNSEDSPDCVVISQDSQPEDKPYGHLINTSDITNNLQSKTVYRLQKKTDTEGKSIAEPVSSPANDQIRPEINGNETETNGNSTIMAKEQSDDNDAIPGKALIRGQLALEKRAKSQTASDEVPDATRCVSFKNGDDSTSDCSPLAFLYKSTDEEIESKTSTEKRGKFEEIVLTDDSDTIKRREILHNPRKPTQSSEDVHVSVPSSPSQLLKSRNQRRARQVHSSQSNSNFGIKNVRARTIGHNSPKSGSVFKCGSAKSPVDQIRMKYKKMYSKSKSPIQGRSQQKYDSFDEDPLSAIRTTSPCKQTNVQASTSDVSLNTGVSYPLSKPTKTKILSSLEQIRSRIKAKTVPPSDRNDSSDSEKQTCKKHSDASKYKRSNRSNEDAEQSPELHDPKIARFHELRNKISGMSRSSSVKYTTIGNSSQRMPVIENSNDVIGRKYDYNHTADTTNNLPPRQLVSQKSAPESTNVDSKIRNSFSVVKESEKERRENADAASRSSIEMDTVAQAESRKRNVFETPKGSNSISAKLARLSKGCSDCDISKRGSQVISADHLDNFEDEAEIFKQKYALFRNRSAYNSGTYTPKRSLACSLENSSKMDTLPSCAKQRNLRLKFMTTADFMTTPENFDFDTALKSLESSQNSLRSDCNFISQEESVREETDPSLCGQFSCNIQNKRKHETDMDVNSPENQYVIYDSYTDDKDDSRESFHMFPVKVPSFDEMNALISSDSQERSEYDIKDTEHRLFCHDSPLLSDSTFDGSKVSMTTPNTATSSGRKSSVAGRKSLTIRVYTPSVLDIESNKNSRLKTSLNGGASSSSSVSSSLLKEKSTSDYNVQYISLSEVESIQYIGPTSESFSGENEETQIPANKSVSSKLSARWEESKIDTERTRLETKTSHNSNEGSHVPFPGSQGFSTVNEVENTQPFKNVSETQGFEPQHDQSMVRETCVEEREVTEGKRTNMKSVHIVNTEQTEIEESPALTYNDNTEINVIDKCSTNLAIKEEGNTTSRNSAQVDSSDQEQKAQDSSSDLTGETSSAAESAKEDNFTPIGQDWVCKVDTRSGRKIYVNLKTGNSSFAEPQLQDTTGTCDMISGRNKVRLLTQNSGQFIKGEKVSTLANSRDVKSNKSLGNSSEVSHLIEDHIESQKEEDAVKWRDPENDLAHDPEAGQSIVQLFEDWDNPTFRSIEQDVVNAEAGSKDRKGQRINSTLNPQTFTKDMLKSIKVLRQIDRKFIACVINAKTENDPNGPELLIVIDQHAAHERVRLEKMTQTAYGEEDRKQILSCKVVPAVQLSLAEEYVRLMEAYRKQFSRMGVEFKTDDRCTISVHVVPAMFVERELSESKKYCDPAWLPTQLELLIKEQVDALQRTHGSVASLPLTLHKILCSRACKGAIKFGDRMTVAECEELIGQLSECQLPFQCAHGRPSLMPLLNLNQVKRQCPKGQPLPKPKLYKLKVPK